MSATIAHSHRTDGLWAEFFEQGLEISAVGCPGCRAERVARRDAEPLPEPPTPAFPAPSDEITAWPAHDATEWTWDEAARDWSRITSAEFGPFTVTLAETYDGKRFRYGQPEVEVDRADASPVTTADALTSVFEELAGDLACAQLAAINALRAVTA